MYNISRFTPGPGQLSPLLVLIFNLQENFWSDILQELIIIITILGAAIAFVFSLLVLKILATR